MRATWAVSTTRRAASSFNYAALRHLSRTHDTASLVWSKQFFSDPAPLFEQRFRAPAMLLRSTRNTTSRLQLGKIIFFKFMHIYLLQGAIKRCFDLQTLLAHLKADI